MKTPNIILAVLLLIAGQSGIAQRTHISDNQNYVVSVIPTSATDEVRISDGVIWMNDDTKALVTVQYFDGLGRPIQTVQRGITPQQSDLINYTEYDGAGRAFRQWLPTPIPGNDGAFMDITTLSRESKRFYVTDRTPENFPYTEALLEKSALGRIEGTRQPGMWNSHPENISYETNTVGDVIIFEVVNSAGNLRKTPYTYNPGELFVIRNTDEDSKTITEFRNKSGQVVMTRQDAGYDTYYVYNDVGQLCFVVPPMGVDDFMKLTGQVTVSDNYPLIKKYCYLYKYDDRGYCTYKRLPGCEPIYMLYDKAGRLVLTQDGNQRLQNKWVIYKYDRLGRLLYTAEIVDTKPYSLEKIDAFANMLVVETFTTGSQPYPMGDTGYSRSYYHAAPTSLLTVNYYDDYQFLGKLNQISKSYLMYSEAKEQEGYGKRHTTAKGMLTGTRTYLLDGSGKFVTTAFYYDARGRVVQALSTNHQAGFDCTYNRYNFMNAPVKTLKEHKTIQLNEIVRELYRYTYDHAGRLIDTEYVLNNNAPVLLSKQHYDEIGRLQKKQRHNNTDMEIFRYNIRNWITKINSGTFEQELFYNINLPSGASPCYNGNIAATSYTSDSKKFTTSYTYDRQNRLTFGGGGNCNGNMEYFTYDKHGNITDLKRFKEYSPLDFLTFSYNGNQVSQVTDQFGSKGQYAVKEYHDKSNSATEFTFDKNGNMIKDMDRKITNIRYNILNLPDTVLFETGNRIVNLYAADGQKLTTHFITTYEPRPIPMLSMQADAEQPAAAEPADQVNQPDIAAVSINPKTMYRTTTQHYIGNMEYGASMGNVSGGTELQRIHHPEGYIENGYVTGLGYKDQFFYYRKDHQGNNREVWNATTNQTVQRTGYYPSGLPWANAVGAGVQPYLYNGKELVEMHDYDSYDYHARTRLAAIPLFTTPDPLAEKYYSTSPYAYCLNNPVLYIDPDGRSTHINNLGYVVQVLHDGDFGVYHHNNLSSWDSESDLPTSGKGINKLGETTSISSFYDWDTGTHRGHIDFSDGSGAAFLRDIFSNTPSLIHYMPNATGGKKYDFKRNGLIGEDDINYFYRGMVIHTKKDGTKIITSARDVGNITAGFMAGVNGIPWGLARTAFDALEVSQRKLSNESISTQNAERFGYNLGISVFYDKFLYSIKSIFAGR